MPREEPLESVQALKVVLKAEDCLANRFTGRFQIEFVRVVGHFSVWFELVALNRDAFIEPPPAQGC